MTFNDSRVEKHPQQDLPRPSGTARPAAEQPTLQTQPVPTPQNAGLEPNNIPVLPPALQPPSIAPPAAHEPSVKTADGEHLPNGSSPRRPTAGQPARDAVEAVGQAAVLQRAFINKGDMVGTKYVYEQTLDSHAPISPEYLAVVRTVFAEPHHEAPQSPSPFKQALEALHTAGSVLVVNRPPNSGRTFIAYALLAHLLDEGIITEVRPLPFGGAQHFPTRRLPHDHQCGYLLELPPDEDDFTVHDSFGGNLHKLVERLQRRDCRLIVLGAV